MDGSGQRRHRVHFGVLCLLVFVIGNAKADAEACRTGCKGAAQTFKYAVGTTYQYNYDGKIEISLSSADGQTTSTEVKATVLLSQQPECNQVLRLQNVEILGANGKKFGKIPDIEKPIRVNFNDGVLEDSICAEQGDSQNSINVKRAILSIFQASPTSSYETDVFGRCPTELSSHKEGNILVIQKTKNLNKCSFREHIQQDFLTTAFNLNSEIKSSPILNGDYQATLRLKNGILEQATVTENYLYVPFSVGKNGAKAHITSKLQLTGSSKDNPKVQVTRPRTIIFENPHPIIASTSNVDTILHAVKEMAKTIDVVVGESTAREFVNIVKIVRVSKKNDLLSVYNQVKHGVGFGDKEAAKRLYLDALLRAGSGDTIEAAIELLRKNELDVIETKLVYVGLSFVRHATEGSINAALHLLNSADLPREAYLGIGNLVGHFCRQHSCENVAAVNTLTNKLLDIIGKKADTRESENDIIYALKSLSNFHHLNDNLLQKLITLAQDKKGSSRIRVTALETYLADPCKDKLRDSALTILQDIQQDSEVRIKAYLVIAKCPNAKLGNAVKNLLEKEPSLQVGGFITSHVRSIRASANPDKTLTKQFLGFNPKKKFPIDPRKYSFNGEFSYAINTLGLAASSEANLIYSQNSWLPRSSSLNLSAEVFGHNLNFFEINARQENLDRLIEHYMGPNGVLKSSQLKNFVGQGKETVQKISEYIETKLKPELQRSKRDVSKNEIDYIAKQVQIKTNALNKDLDVDLSFKAFGSELLFVNLNQNTEKLTVEALIDKLVSEIGKGLDNLNNFEKTLRSNLLFLDAEFDYPTSLGFPLRLAVEGTSTVQVRTEGAVNIRKLLNSPEKGQFNLKVIPSANVEVAGRLTLDALVVENGLKIVSTLYSSTGGDINLSWDRTNGFDLKFGLPVQEQKLISANHEIVFHTREQASREENMPLKFTQVKDFSICLDQLSPFVGLTFCAEVNGPNLGGQQIPILPFPLAGDAKLSITIENEDVSNYRVRQILRGDPSSHTELIFETIGKNNQRKVSLELQAETSPQRYIKAIFSSPFKSAFVEANLINTSKEKSLLLHLSNDKDEFSGKIGVVISGSPQREVYKPILEYKTPSGKQPLPVSIQGQIILERNGQDVKYIFDNVKLLDQTRAFGINGNAGLEGRAFFSDLAVSDGLNSISLEGRFQLSAELIKFNIKVLNTINNNANFNLKGEFKRQPNQYDSSIQLIHGSDLSSKTAILTLTNSFECKYKDNQDFTYKTKNKISYPLLGIASKFSFELTPKSVDYEIIAEYGDLKVGSEFEGKINSKNVGDYEVEFEIWGLDNKLELKSRRQVLGNDESKIANTLEINGKKLEIEGTLRHHLRPHDIDFGADLILKIPTHSTPYSISSGLKINIEELDAHQKISSGSDHILDAFIKANKAGNANGSLKVNIKDILTINAKVISNKGVGNGDIIIEVKNGKRQIKGDTSFKIQHPDIFDVSVTLYPAFNKDKNLKILFSTQNIISETGLDTKNKVNILGHPLEINLKISRTGDHQNGNIGGEIEVTLPGDQYLLSKANCVHKEENEVRNGYAQGSLEYRKNKNSPGRKVSYKNTWKNVNLQEGIVEMEYALSADDSNGQNINSDISLKTTRQGDNRQLQYSYKIYGSLLKLPLEGSISSQFSKSSGTYEIRGSYGSANIITVTGQHNCHDEAKRLGSLKVELSTASPSFKTLNVDLRGSLIRAPSKIKSWQLEGSVNIFADDDGTNPDPIIDVKCQGEVNVHLLGGEIKGNLTISKTDPISVDAIYNRKETSVNNEGTGSVTLSYGKGKTVKVDASIQHISDNQYKITAGVQTPVESYENIQLSVETKRSKDIQDVNHAIQLSVNGKIWKLITDLTLSDLSPIVDIKFTTSDGKLSQIYLRGHKVSERQFEGQIKLVDEEKQFTFDGDLNINIKSIEEFLIKGNVNSPVIQLNKIVFEAENKPGSSDRRIQVMIKTGDKNLISGSTNYAAKEENGKYIVEGSGTFKVKDETKSGNFKYILQRLSSEKNHEEGIQISFDAHLGNQFIDSEFKTSNKQFRLQNSYCEEKKDCAHLEIDNKVNTNDLRNYNQVLEINIDLRKLGLSHEFGLKAVTNRKGWVIDHTVDAHFQNQENSKYQYSFYVHPNDAGVSLTTPKRIVSFEAKSNLPNYREGGKGTGEIAFYIDKKNHANKKTALSWLLEVDPKGSVNGETKFTHPGLQKPLEASIKATRHGNPYNGEIQVVVEIDVFDQSNQKIITTYKKHVSIDDAKSKGTSEISLALKSSGLGIDILANEVISGDTNTKLFNYDGRLLYQVGQSKYENVLTSKWSQNEISGLLRLLNIDILKVINRLNINKQEQVIDSEISSYNKNPVISQFEFKNFDTLSYSVGFKKTPNEKLQLNAGLIPGQIADIRSDYLNGNAKTNLFFANIKLDEAHFLKSDYNVDSKEIEKVLKRSKQRSTVFLNGLEDIGKEWANNARKEVQQIRNLAKKSAPNLQPLNQYYAKEFKEFKDEILYDKNIKVFGETVRNILGSMLVVASEIFEKISQLAEQIAQTVQNSFQSVIDSIEKGLVPQLKEIADRLIFITREILDSTLDIVLGLLAKISQIVEQYQPEFKELAATFGELGQDFGKVIQASYSNFRESLRSLVNRITTELKALPVLEELRAQYEQFLKEGIPNADAIINTIREVFTTIKDAIPPQFIVKNDISDLLDTISGYIEKRLKNQPIDDFATFEKIGKAIAIIFKKIVSLVTAEKYDIPVAQVDSNFLFPINYIHKLPRLVAVKFSPISYLLDELPSAEVVKFLLSLSQSRLLPPFSLFGMVIQGQHIFTFDGKHITYPGTCNYLLVRDALNGNFTLAGTYKDGLLTAITLADKTDSITLIKGGQVKLNNVGTDLPLRKPNLAAYRDYEIITIYSKAGIVVDCVPDLIGCAISVSGYYHGQLKGLLGNGNNEPYDDLRLPNGKIVASEGEFGNAFKMSSGCADVTVPKHDHVAENPACNKIFSWDSPLRLCYSFVATENFKAACAHGLAANVKGTEEAIAKAYVAACNERNIPVATPDKFVKCLNSDKTYNLGDAFSVKLPAKAADIVLIVDTEKQNEQLYKQLVQPLVQELGKELHSKGINDVEFHLITYGGINQWPSHVTVNGKITFKGKAPQVKFGETPEDPLNLKDIENPAVKKYAEILKEVLHDINLATGFNLKTRTFSEAQKYPFRANALKSIVVVNSKPCEVGRFYPLQKLSAYVFKNSKISLNLFTPFTSLSLKDAKKTKDVVGFNTQNVFTLSQGKKNPKGNAELHKELNYEDYCVDFTLKNRGNAFVNDNFLLNKAEQKQFVHIAASNIVDQLINIEQGLDCECTRINPWSAINVCQEAYSKERPSKKV